MSDRYELGEVIGRGAMAEVLDALDQRLHRRVAVKRLLPDLARDPEARARFEHEARIAAGLSHPNVVAVYDTGEDADGRPFLVMERLPGPTLADVMAGGPMPEDKALRVASDVLSALGAAEAIGLVHRDIKPANILMTGDGRAKVADFGIAKAAEGTSDATATGLLMGTPAYLAPERIEGQPATNRSDLYAVGVILFEALSGRRAFAPGTPAAVAAASVTQGVPRLGPDEASPATAAAVSTATARRPEDRFASASAMSAALGLGLAEPAASDRTTVLGAPIVPPVASPRAVAQRVAPLWASWEGWGRRVGLDGRRLVVAAAAVLVLVLLLSSWALGGSGSSPRPTSSSVPVVQSTLPPSTTTTVTAPVVVPRGKHGGKHDD